VRFTPAERDTLSAAAARLDPVEHEDGRLLLPAEDALAPPPDPCHLATRADPLPPPARPASPRDRADPGAAVFGRFEVVVDLVVRYLERAESLE